MSAHHTLPPDDPAAWLHELVHHLEHVLPAQAPIKDFVHHNTLHGFQHLPFREALTAAEAETGAHGFLPAETFRAYFQQGRIDLGDLNAALDETPELRADAMLPGGIARRDVLLTGLRFDLSPLTAGTLDWRIEDMGALTRFQDGVDETAQARVQDQARSPAHALPDLWTACQAALGIAPDDHDEAVERLPEEDEATQQWSERQLKHDAAGQLTALLDRVGGDLSLRGLLLTLTGRDLMDELRPYLIRHLAAHLDQGMAAWHNPVRAQGLYAAWLASARHDPHFELNDLPGWQSISERLPDAPAACILQELQLLGLPGTHWAGYLSLLAKELPGWSGMVLWRHQHPGYAGETIPIDMLDYLALRLVMERVYAARLTAAHFNCEASLPGLRGHLRRHPAEQHVRLALYTGQLPEWLEDHGHRLVRNAVHSPYEEDDRDWLPVARLIDLWRAQPSNGDACSRGAHAWPLFMLCQHLGLPARSLAAMGRDGAIALLDCLHELTPQTAGWLWLQAYERHYREQVFSALVANQDRGPWKTRATRPEAQLMFCMDDREEGLRRHLEELAPNIETLGAAAHFNVPHAWCELDAAATVPLAPVVPSVVIPAHEVREVPQEQDRILYTRHTRRRHTRLAWKSRLMQGTRLGLVGPMLGSLAAAPATLGVLAGKAFAPRMLGRLADTLRRAYELQIATRITFVAPNDSPAATPESRRLGFTDIEQADRVQTLLRSTGLTYGFAPLVVIAGHGSHSQNNPHGSAYNCGACAGNFSGPNARLVTAMANRAEVRALLAERGIVIPDDTWFVGAIHDTCDDVVTWFDTDLIPAALRDAFAQLRQNVDRASQLHAQERSRRFMSASLSMSPGTAWKHVTGRANDFSQARPELGHATNASAYIGRRSATRGAFFDRRIFLISYDPTQDPDGSIVERQLLANGAVGAGISLEYYFSTVNNERYGCGTKTMHNVAGLLGVMEGAASDLRTGLPRQMIEVHEAMRVLAIVEQKIDVLTAVYQRQPPLQELVGNGWIQLAAKDPDSDEIHRFVPGTGWVKWQPAQPGIPMVACSADWYRGQRDALPPTLIERGANPA